MGEPFDLVRLKLIPWYRLSRRLIEKEYRKYQFLLGFLKELVPMYGKALLVDDNYYVMVNEKINEQTKQQLGLDKTDPVADLLADFLEEIDWPVENMTVANEPRQSEVSNPGEAVPLDGIEQNRDTQGNINESS